MCHAGFRPICPSNCSVHVFRPSFPSKLSVRVFRSYRPSDPSEFSVRVFHPSLPSEFSFRDFVQLGVPELFFNSGRGVVLQFGAPSCSSIRGAELFFNFGSRVVLQFGSPSCCSILSWVFVSIRVDILASKMEEQLGTPN